MNSSDALYITGKTPLSGQFQVNNAKNSALILILGALLTEEKITLRNVPKLSDVLAMLEMLEYLGADVSWDNHDLSIQVKTIRTCAAPYHLVSKMRASFVAMGALLARCGEARISMPGGCAFGPRPVDRHIKAFRALGAEVQEEGGDFFVKRHQPLTGRVVFEGRTVGGTQNIMLAAVLGKDTVIIENAALEPEIIDLATMLNLMGANVEGAGSPTITITGVDTLHGVDYRPIPDRIEAGTIMLAIAACRSTVTLNNVNPAHLRAVLAKLNESGVRTVELDNNRMLIDATGPLKAINIDAAEYPGVPTDLQAPFGAYLATVEGVSVITDRVYPDRFTHVDEMVRAGGQLELKERTLIVRESKLNGTQMHAADIRAGGALIVAALAAEGKSVITGLEYIQRGYENIAERLQGLGAQIRLEETEVVATGTYGD